MRKRTHRTVGLLAAPFVAGFGLIPLAAAPAAADHGTDVFISEIHYDNDGTDAGERVEVQAPAGTDLTGWSIVLYRDTGTVYDTRIISGAVNASNLLVEEWPSNGIQNGDADGLALVDPAGAVVELLSYEGTLTATAGPAVGMTSTDIGVTEGSSTPLGASLQRDPSDHGTWYGPVTNTFGLVNPEAPTGPEPVTCDTEVTHPISEVQGSDDASPLIGERVTIEGVVTAVKPGLGGFYVQEEAADVDADPTTSEGIFVFTGDAPSAVEQGQQVRVNGTVDEYQGTQTQLADDPTTAACGSGSFTIEPTPVELGADGTLERYEGMLVELTESLVISEYFNYDRFGEVVLALPPNGWDRLHTPTAVVEPGDAARELAAQYEDLKITIDDSLNVQNPETVPHPGNGEPFSLDNRFRGGDTVTGIEGVLDHTFDVYRLQPTAYGDYTVENPRPTDAPEVGGTLQVASFNVLNYFLTLDEGEAVCGPLQNMDCRGANTPEEFERQRAKIIAALVELDADVVGLMEMENTTGVEPAADLVAGLNAVLGEGTYDYIDTGVIGTDAIRVGFLYKPGVVEPVGDFAILDSSVDPRFLDDKNRPMLTQTFDEVATGARVTVSVNHLKSKGSDCEDVGDPDTGDGQGNCNVTRTLAAEAILDFLAADPTDSGDPDHLVIGDLNSYDHEDPIDVFIENGYTDLIRKYGGELAYGYVFDGMVGYLDHALSNPTLTPQVTGAEEWHINADEPDILDYDMSFKSDSMDALYEPTFYRSSDHDPVLVGLDLFSAETCYTDGAQTVGSYEPGIRANGTPVPPGHTDAGQALGLSDPGGDDPYWVTLGMGGEIVLEFANPIQNTNGDEADVRVVDVNDGGKGRTDAATVYASVDGETWTEVGTVTGTGEVNLGDLMYVTHVKVVDNTPTEGRVNPATDGYDLDAVEVLTACVVA